MRPGGRMAPPRRKDVKDEVRVRPGAGRLHQSPPAPLRKAISLSSCCWAQTSRQNAISSTKQLASVSVWGWVSEVEEGPSNRPLPLPERGDFISFPLPPSEGFWNDRSAVSEATALGRVAITGLSGPEMLWQQIELSFHCRPLSVMAGVTHE